MWLDHNCGSRQSCPVSLVFNKFFSTARETRLFWSRSSKSQHKNGAECPLQNLLSWLQIHYNKVVFSLRETAVSIKENILKALQFTSHEMHEERYIFCPGMSRSKIRWKSGFFSWTEFTYIDIAVSLRYLYLFHGLISGIVETSVAAARGIGYISFVIHSSEIPY